MIPEQVWTEIVPLIPVAFGALLTGIIGGVGGWLSRRHQSRATRRAEVQLAWAAYVTTRGQIVAAVADNALFGVSQNASSDEIAERRRESIQRDMKFKNESIDVKVRVSKKFSDAVQADVDDLIAWSNNPTLSPLPGGGQQIVSPKGVPVAMLRKMLK